MTTQIPYFLTNKEWFKIEYNNKNLTAEIKLTDKAPKKAIDSYKEYKKKGSK